LLIKGKGQRLGDVAAGTAVVRVKKQIALEDLLGTSSLNFIDSNKIIFDEVKDLNFAQYEVIIETYNWAKIKNNHKLINTLSDKIKETLKIKSDMLSTELVETVISDYQRINNM
jgi:hypothetical protein